MSKEGGQEAPLSWYFTYTKPLGNDISQGDVIPKNAAINNIISTIHPHYHIKEDYTHFIILTQSCDLIKRDDKCKARYITLAAVRPLELVIFREIQKYQDEFKKTANINSKSIRFRVYQFLESLLNNNDPEYFYLHKNEELGFPNSSVAFLRLSIALKIEHYDDILNSRILSLKDIFKAKLGWLVGNMYSRVGTDEWVPRFATQEEFSQNINYLLDSSCEWVEEKQLREAKRLAGDEWKHWDQQKIRQFVRNIAIPDKKEKIIESVLMILESLEIITGENIGQKRRDINNTLRNDPIFSSLAK